MVVGEYVLIQFSNDALKIKNKEALLTVSQITVNKRLYIQNQKGRVNYLHGFFAF